MNKMKNISLTLFWVLFLIQASTLATSEDARVNNNCIPGERAALLTLKAGFVDPKNHLSSWEGLDCCSWSGVTCSNGTRYVVKLDLGNTYIQYNQVVSESWFPDFSYALGGEIRSSMLVLERLNYLDLSCNSFSGAKVPEFIGSLKELRYLNLSRSNFDGRIPPQLGNLSSLQYLDLSYQGNNLYTDDVAWLAHLSSLKHLDLSRIILSRAINWESLGMLPHLQTLDLSYCQLNDTTFSSSHVNFTKLLTFHLRGNELSNPLSSRWIWNITGLKYVDFSSNNFDGRFPDVLKNMNSIEELYLGDNCLIDMKPSDLKNLTNLKVLDLTRTQITADITEFIEDLSPYQLQSLYFGQNNFFGNLTGWIGRMTNLSILNLEDNKLSGSIPSSIRMLTKLIVLDLSDNYFLGALTVKHLSKMTSLEHLDLSKNSLSLIVNANLLPPFRLIYADFSSCRLGPEFPEWLKWQTNINYLDISNTSIADEVPIWFWHVYSKTSYLDLSKNNLTGVMPESLEFMSTTWLLLSDNQFQGLVPQLPKGLHVLDLSENALTGSLLFNWEDLQLRALILRHNLLNCSIPQSIFQLEHLELLDLSHNFFVGNFPNGSRNNPYQTQKNYSRLGPSNQSFVQQSVLKSLILSHNNLSGEFPMHLKYCSNLILLNLGNNNFFGSIPPWIRNKMPSLRFLILGSNRFNGTIPCQLFELENLQILDLSNNKLNGMIPSSLKTLMAMTSTSGSDDMYVGPNLYIQIGASTHMLIGLTITEVNIEGPVLEFEDSTFYLTSLDLSCNNLVGNIPEVIGALDSLINLNLSRNKLSGDIPKSIGNSQSLESLDFSNNELSGSIPSSLSALSFLSYLNLSYNNLSGRIPSGNQLQTLDSSSYKGNNGLCGPPLPIKCFENKTMAQPFVYEREHNHEVYAGAIGFAVGAWMIYGALIFKKSWRVTYFLFVDSMYDRLYVFVHWARIAQK